MGDEIVELDGDYYHTECFEDSATCILVEQFGATKGVAGADRWDL